MGQRSGLGRQTCILWIHHRTRYEPPTYHDLTNSVTVPIATQTLGEEYTDIWQYSSSRQASPPLPQARAGLILLPILSAYILGRWGNALSVGTRYPRIGVLLKRLPTILEVVAEINLAIFYLRGTYYDLVKRLLGIRHVRHIHIYICD